MCHLITGSPFWGRGNYHEGAFILENEFNISFSTIRLKKAFKFPLALLLMLVRGKVVGKEGTARFEVQKSKEGVSLRVEFPEGEPIDYSVDCPCLEPLELLGLLLPAIEEHIGEVQDVVVEEVEEQKSILGRIKRLLRERK